MTRPLELPESAPVPDSPCPAGAQRPEEILLAVWLSCILEHKDVDTPVLGAFSARVVAHAIEHVLYDREMMLGALDDYADGNAADGLLVARAMLEQNPPPDDGPTPAEFIRQCRTDAPAPLSSAGMAAIRQRAEAATAMVGALCKPRGSDGAREWIMSIPAQAADPDVVIAAALADIPRLLADLERARAALRAVLDWLDHGAISGDSSVIAQREAIIAAARAALGDDA